MCAGLAQLAARQSHNLKVVSSNLTFRTTFLFQILFTNIIIFHLINRGFGVLGHYNFVRLSIKIPPLNVVAVHAPVRVNVTLVVPFVLNLSAETPPDMIVAVLSMIIGAALLNTN